jgi:hypothetical protein
MNETREILRTMRAVAQIEPPTAQMRQAIDSARHAITADQVPHHPSPHRIERRVLVHAGIAAALVIATAGVLITHPRNRAPTLVPQPRAQAVPTTMHSPQQEIPKLVPDQEQLQQAISLSNRYQGWVDVTLSNQTIDDSGQTLSPTILTQMRMNPAEGRQVVLNRRESQSSAASQARTVSVDLVAGGAPTRPAASTSHQSIGMLIPLTWDAKTIPIPLTWEGTAMRFVTPDQAQLTRQKQGAMDVFNLEPRSSTSPSSSAVVPERTLISVDSNTNLVKKVQTMYRLEGEKRIATFDYNYGTTMSPSPPTTLQLGQ